MTRRHVDRLPALQADPLVRDTSEAQVSAGRRPDAAPDPAQRNPEVDEVDAQSEQSFPASDSPSWSGSSISGGRDQEVKRDPE